MTVKRKIIYIVGLAAIIIGTLIWQFNKKQILKNEVEAAVKISTDSLYTIHYDSSSLDEVTGSASFYNLRLQSDSMMEQVLTNDSTTDRTIFNIATEALHITGLDVPSFLQKQTISAKNIELIHPVIKIITSGKSEIKFEQGDSLALYERIIGNFRKINADNITIKDALVLLSNGKNKPHTQIKDLSVNLSKFIVDSTRNYDNIVSYFVKDVIVNAKEFSSESEQNGSSVLMQDIQYNAPGKFLTIGKAVAKDKNGKESLLLTGNRIGGISTDAFVRQRKILADTLKTGGGHLNIRTGGGEANSSKGIEIENNFFDRAQVKNIIVGNTDVTIVNTKKPAEAPVELKNVRFTTSGLQTIAEGDKLSDIVLSSNWNLRAGGYSTMSKDKMYRINIGEFTADKLKKTLNVSSVKVIPQLSEEAFMARQKVQTDRYDLSFTNLNFTGVDIAALTDNKQLIAETGTIQPSIKIFNDRTLPPNPASKVGNYPQQMLLKVDMPVFIKKLTVRNGLVAYKERGAISKQSGTVNFTNVNATINNVTNIKERIAGNPNMVLNATAKFLDKAPVNTKWTFPLNSSKGEFIITGTIGAMDAKALNAVSEPLGITRVSEGKINRATFNMDGDDLHAKGRVTVLYEDLKMALLKEQEGELKKRGLISTAANIFLKDDNPSNGTTRSASFNMERDKTRSFFNLVWKSIFDGAKKITMGKSD